MPEGWLTKPEQNELARLAAGRQCLEVGAWCGLSTTTIARHAVHLVTIDHWRGDSYTEAVAGPRTREQLLPKWLRTVAEHGLEDRVAPLVGDLHQLLPLLAPERFGLVFYDADHAMEPTLFALQWAALGIWRRQRMGDNWAVAIHDYKPKGPTYVATCQAIDAWARQHQLQLRFVDSLAIVEGGPKCTSSA